MTRAQALKIQQRYAELNRVIPDSIRKQVDEVLSKPSTEMSSTTAKKVLKADPTNQAAQEAVNVANAGYEHQVQPWVTEYTSPAEGGKYKFNWQQYAFRDNPELATANALTPEQIKKIDDERLAAMHGVADRVDFNKLATDMHFKDAREKWSDFVNSDRFAQFENYMSDVAQYQQDERLDEIWNKEDPFGRTVVDFTLPVSKEYAKKNYENIDGYSDMAAPLAADVAMNAAMMGSGKVAGKIGSKAVSKAVDYSLAPVVQEAGQMLVNDKNLTDAATDAALGTGANAGTPYAIRGTYGILRRGAGTLNKVFPWKTNASKVLDEAVDVAKQARKKQANTITHNQQTGSYIDTKSKTEYVDDATAAIVSEHPLAHEGWKYAPRSKMPDKEVVNVAEDKSYIFQPEAEARDAANMNLRDVSGLKNKAKTAVSNVKNILTRNKAVPNEGYAPKARSEEFYSKMPEEMRAVFKAQDERAAKTFWDRVNKIQEGTISVADWQDNYNATQAAYQYLGIPVRESGLGFLKRVANDNQLAKDYFSNLYGTSPRAKNYSRQLVRSLPIVSDYANDADAKKQAEQEQQAATYRLLLNRR